MTALAQRQQQPAGLQVANSRNLEAYLSEHTASIVASARGNLNGEQIARAVLREVGNNDKLQKCTVSSVYQALLMALELGLTPGAGLGEAYLVPYGGVCQMQVGYKGLTTLAYRSGFVGKLQAMLVYKSDVFNIDYACEPMFTHKPDIHGTREDQDIIGAYCLIKLRNEDQPIFEYMSRKEIDKIRNSSPGRNSDAWTKWFGEMARKCVIKRACKPLPKTPELAKALAWDNAVDSRDYRNIVPFDNVELISPETAENVPDPDSKVIAADPEAIKQKNADDANKKKREAVFARIYARMGIPAFVAEVSAIAGYDIAEDNGEGFCFSADIDALKAANDVASKYDPKAKPAPVEVAPAETAEPLVAEVVPDVAGAYPAVTDEQLKGIRKIVADKAQAKGIEITWLCMEKFGSTLDELTIDELNKALELIK